MPSCPLRLFFVYVIGEVGPLSSFRDPWHVSREVLPREPVPWCPQLRLSSSLPQCSPRPRPPSRQVFMAHHVFLRCLWLSHRVRHCATVLWTNPGRIAGCQIYCILDNESAFHVIDFIRMSARCQFPAANYMLTSPQHKPASTSAPLYHDPFKSSHFSQPLFSSRNPTSLALKFAAR